MTLLSGHCLNVLRGMPSDSVHCCVTSPPYLGLRDYGTPSQVWGGKATCRHRWSPDNFCRQCDAWRGSLGLEPLPRLYVAHIVEIFREVRRVLRGDGTLWLVIGDTYSTSNSKFGIPAKNLLGIPWQVALALQADGWMLRSEILWHKPNAVPEKVADRPTRDHETLFLFSKQGRYHYDSAAIAEPLAPSTLRRIVASQSGRQAGFSGVSTRPEIRTPAGRIMPSGWTPKQARTTGGGKYLRNRRTVWKVSTQGYRGAHFATFPPGLVRPCVLAGCPEGGTVLDPFMGSGTTGLVAAQEGRNAIGIELNGDYVGLANKRVLPLG